MFVMHISKIVIKAIGGLEAWKSILYFSDTNIKMVVDC